jgi:hypothetical protein
MTEPIILEFERDNYKNGYNYKIKAVTGTRYVNVGTEGGGKNLFINVFAECEFGRVFGCENDFFHCIKLVQKSANQK